MYADVVVLKGEEVIQYLQSLTLGCLMHFGLIYALNFSYPKELKCTFEVFQKNPNSTGHNKTSTEDEDALVILSLEN